MGKTTTAVNLSTAMAMTEKRTLPEDSCPKGYATMERVMGKAKLYHQAMTGKINITRTILGTPPDFYRRPY